MSEATGRFRVVSVREFDNKVHTEIEAIGWDKFPVAGPEFDDDLNPVRDETPEEAAFNEEVAERYDGLNFPTSHGVLKTHTRVADPGDEVEIAVSVAEPMVFPEAGLKTS